MDWYLKQNIRGVIHHLESTLNKKSSNFTRLEKQTTGYYYLMALISKMDTLAYNNYGDFVDRIDFIINMFPTKRNGSLRYGKYLTHYYNFRKYIRKEYGYLHINVIYWKTFIYLSLSGLVIGVFTNIYMGIILGLFLGHFIGISREKYVRKQGLILDSELSNSKNQN